MATSMEVCRLSSVIRCGETIIARIQARQWLGAFIRISGEDVADAWCWQRLRGLLTRVMFFVHQVRGVELTD